LNTFAALALNRGIEELRLQLNIATDTSPDPPCPDVVKEMYIAAGNFLRAIAEPDST
jgi:hypothetical protein